MFGKMRHTVTKKTGNMRCEHNVNAIGNHAPRMCCSSCITIRCPNVKEGISMCHICLIMLLNSCQKVSGFIDAFGSHFDASQSFRELLARNWIGWDSRAGSLRTLVPGCESQSFKAANLNRKFEHEIGSKCSGMPRKLVVVGRDKT
jgi:hypothetical protein